MVARGGGALVVVSSAAAWQPVPYMATYAATKAFELHLAEALAEELHGAPACARWRCAPGPTRTEFAMTAGTSPRALGDPVRRRGSRGARHVAGAGRAGAARAATGVVSRGSMLASRLLPRGLIVRGAGDHPPDLAAR